MGGLGVGEGVLSSCEDTGLSESPRSGRAVGKSYGQSYLGSAGPSFACSPGPMVCVVCAVCALPFALCRELCWVPRPLTGGPQAPPGQESTDVVRHQVPRYTLWGPEATHPLQEGIGQLPASRQT